MTQILAACSVTVPDAVVAVPLSRCWAGCHPTARRPAVEPCAARRWRPRITSRSEGADRVGCLAPASAGAGLSTGCSVWGTRNAEFSVATQCNSLPARTACSGRRHGWRVKRHPDLGGWRRCKLGQFPSQFCVSPDMAGGHRAVTGGWRSPGRGEGGRSGVPGGYPMQLSAGENGVLRTPARLRAGTVPSRVAGARPAEATVAEAEFWVATPRNSLPARTACSGRRHGWRAGTVPSRVAGACPAETKVAEAEFWVAIPCNSLLVRAACSGRPHGWRAGTVPSRVAGARRAGVTVADAEFSEATPCNSPPVRMACPWRRRRRWAAAVPSRVAGARRAGGEAGQCGILGGYPKQQSAAGEVNRVVFRVRVPRCLGTRGLLQSCFCVTQRGRIWGDDPWR
jgi:hypothetical protein